jgi:hypothetical protein
MPFIIVFAGTSGVDKNSVIERFSQSMSVQLGLAGEGPRQKILVLKPADIETDSFLTGTTSAQMRALSSSFKLLMEEYRRRNAKGADVVLVPLHFTHVYYDRAFTALSWPSPSDNNAPSLLISFLRRLKPDIIVNLIDDIHVVQRRIKLGVHGYRLRLRELIKWREFETSIADYCANEIIRGRKSNNDFAEDRFERSPIFAIQHQQTALARYIFNPDCVRVYASYPISSVRKQRSKADVFALMGEVNDFVAALSSRFVVFNPTTIDEVPLNKLYDRVSAAHRKSKTRTPKSVSLPKSHRWPVPGDNKLSSEKIVDDMQLSWADLQDVSLPDDSDPEARTIIGRQVVARDFRLIDQADCVVIYRPTARAKTWSRGTRNEYDYAKALIGTERPFMRVFILRDKKDAALHPPNKKRTSGTFSNESHNVTIIEGTRLDTKEGRRKVFDELFAEIGTRSTHLTARRAGHSRTSLASLFAPPVSSET